MVENKIFVLSNTLSYMKQQRLWPKSENIKYFYTTFLISLIAYAPSWIAVLLHLIILTQAEHQMNLAQNMANVASYVGSHYIFICYVTKHKTLKTLYEKLSDFKKFGKPTDFDENNIRLNFFSKCVYYYVYVGAVIHSTTSIYYEIPKCKKLNEEYGLNEICGLYISAYIPFDIDYFPAKQIAFVYQVVVAINITRGGALVSFSVFEASHHIVIRIRHLKEMLVKMFDEEDYPKRREKLNFCIRYHRDIIEASQIFDDCYKNGLGVHLLFSGFVCACLLFELLREASPGNMTHLLGWLTALFINCFAGEQLIHESTSIADAAFKSNWNKVEIDLQKDFQFLMLKAQDPLYIHVAPLGYLSLPLFLSIVKASYSYLTLLNESV